MDGFECLLLEHRGAVERYVRFRLSSAADAEDVLQEVYLTAYQQFGFLREKGAFKPWLLSIARNKCSDYFRRNGRLAEVPLDEVPEGLLADRRAGLRDSTPVAETMAGLPPREQEVLRLYFWEELPQTEIAGRLGIPVGTVKSRLHAAKEKFKASYPYPPHRQKGVLDMTKLPEYLPQYTIIPSAEPPFEVVWEETLGWMIVPRVGEKLSWGLYDYPSRRRTEWSELKVVGEAEVHGIRGVEIVAIQHDSEDYYRTGAISEIERRFIAQLTDTHCRMLAETHMEDGVRKCYTFLDEDYFIPNWGYGPDNCGTETHMKPRGIITRKGGEVTAAMRGMEELDVVGRYAVTIAGKTYDTVCIMDCETFNDAVASEQYVDANGRTVLWRRFNRDDWAIDRFGGKRWSEKLPDNERITVNGQTYVHWYDCISDYIL